MFIFAHTHTRRQWNGDQNQSGIFWKLDKQQKSALDDGTKVVVYVFQSETIPLVWSREQILALYSYTKKSAWLVKICFVTLNIKWTMTLTSILIESLKILFHSRALQRHCHWSYQGPCRVRSQQRKKLMPVLNFGIILVWSDFAKFKN